jgi:hypothetical protein
MEITGAKLKTILKEQRKEFQAFVDTSIRGQRREFQTHIGALVEDFTTQVKLVAESISDIQRQLVILREMVAKNTEDIEVMKLDIMVIKEDLGVIKNSLKRKVDIEEFAALERRVLKLEKTAARS